MNVLAHEMTCRPTVSSDAPAEGNGQAETVEAMPPRKVVPVVHGPIQGRPIPTGLGHEDPRNRAQYIGAVREERVLIGVEGQLTRFRCPHDAETLEVRQARIAERAVARSTRQMEIVGRDVEELRPRVRGPERDADYCSDGRPQESPDPGA